VSLPGGIACALGPIQVSSTLTLDPNADVRVELIAAILDPRYQLK
jgi:hypothetical protein